MCIVVNVSSPPSPPFFVEQQARIKLNRSIVDTGHVMYSIDHLLPTAFVGHPLEIMIGFPQPQGMTRSARYDGVDSNVLMGMNMMPFPVSAPRGPWEDHILVADVGSFLLMFIRST